MIVFEIQIEDGTQETSCMQQTSQFYITAIEITLSKLAILVPFFCLALILTPPKKRSMNRSQVSLVIASLRKSCITILATMIFPFEMYTADMSLQVKPSSKHPFTIAAFKDLWLLHFFSQGSGLECSFFPLRLVFIAQMRCVHFL